MKRAIFLISLMLMSFVASSCEEDEDNTKKEDLGKQAAIEFCNCFKKNTKEECLENLKDKYEPAQYMSDGFIESFNEASTCGIELIIEQGK